jgi:hypothetical protein
LTAADLAFLVLRGARVLLSALAVLATLRQRDKLEADLVAAARRAR